MAPASRYCGLCETCDHDATCTLKRSPRLEIIYCEQFSTQPVTRVLDEFENLSCGPGIKTESAKTEC